MRTIQVQAGLAAGVLTVTLCLLPKDLVALDPAKAVTQYRLDVWTEREGLPQGCVQAIEQTKDGYLWLGTRDGLARFDGVTFSVFRAESHPELGANDIRALREDETGRLWIGTFNAGLTCLSSGRMKRYTKADGLPSNGVLDVFPDGQGAVWFGTWNGVARWRDGKFKAYGPRDGLQGRGGWSFCKGSDGAVWVASETAFHRFADERFEVVLTAECWPERVREVHQARDGSLWLATTGQGLFLSREGESVCYTSGNGLPDNKVRTVLEDRDGNVWVGTWSGLCRLRNGTFDVLTTRDGLPHEHVEVLYEDWEGSLWIGTRGGGLARLRDCRVSNFTTREGLAHNFGKCVYKDNQGAMWVGTHGGGLSRYQDGRFTTFTTEHGLCSQFVWAIDQDRQGNIWVGTGRPAGLHVYKDGKFIRHRSPDGLGVRNGVRAIASDKEGNLWVGGDGRGLCRFRDGTFTCFTTADGLPSSSIRVLREDRLGNLWIGTSDGLSRYQDGRFTCYTIEDGLAHNAVYALLEERDGTLWFGTQGGLSRYKDGQFRSYSSKDGLFQDVIYQILQDENENLWLSSNRGIFTISKQALRDFDSGKLASLSCISYGIADGMKTVQCEGATQPAGCQDSNGKFWFPTASGVAVIDPLKMPVNRQPPPVLIERVWAGKDELAPARAARIPAGAHEFRFQYTALSFAAPEKVRFKYKLEGVDDGWVDAETRRVAFYNKVPPGNYRFHVIGCNSDGIWNEAGATFAFTLLPHFYQTAWFYGVWAVAAVAAGWSFHRHRMRRAHAQFAVVLAERNRIARDLHDTLAQGFAGIAFQLEAVATKLAEAPARAQQHLNLALQMVRHSLTEARRSVMNLRSAALDNVDLAQALADTARNMTADRPVDVHLNVAGPVRALPNRIENDLLHIGQEAITNSLKYSGTPVIQIDLKYQPKSVILSIKDSGEGFEVERVPIDGDAHFGLLGMRERAKQLGAHLTIRSQPGEGTEVLIKVPLS